ncbi:phosphate acyltransferase PlsX [Pseudogracilibacillus auburnensis]|uniref:Phosphate acyltransferase n=1 Tax=Pseudogracilibacillus auburnensis TaxID=1494959 RepID=A0A2V3W6B4_9BACI|nr:phosphate acyltransferase PlsX [Pseudogracilibacillus auburnensis]PXW88571.1 phosphate:acyl-[acyl carrier protein] acyltransferase [Pseudogracilibacillus auburnensis]
MKIAIDAMGGDNAPKVVVEGAMEAIDNVKELHITLVGNENEIKKYLSNDERITIIHTNEMIEGDEEPIRAVRRKKNASVVLMANEVKEKRADACISAGNTGALVVSGLFVVGRTKGIDRPALSPTLPTADGKGFLLLDAGANVDASAHNLVQYGVMGSIYCEKVRMIPKPTVGLLNVGTEDGKGNNVTKKAFQQLANAPIHFIGNVEARDLLNGVADVVVTDGFSGNITLKSIEGTALHVMKLLKNTLTSSLKTKLAAGLIKNDLKKLKNELDYPEYGGAALFGLSAPVIKSHGSSNSRAIYHTIKQACHMIENDVIGTIERTVTSLDFVEEE